MRVLLLHPEDDFRGPWADLKWDVVVDLGRAPKSFYQEWSSTLGCPVFSIFDLAIELEDLQLWGRLLELGMGQVAGQFWDRLVGRDQSFVATGDAERTTWTSPGWKN